MAKTMKSKKKSKKLMVKPRLPSSGTWTPKSEARLQEFMAHAIGSHADAYLKNLAMTVVHLKVMSEIAALQSDLQKEKAEIAQARLQLSLERERVTGVRSSIPLSKESVVEASSRDHAETPGTQAVVRKSVIKKTPFGSGRCRG